MTQITYTAIGALTAVLVLTGAVAAGSSLTTSEPPAVAAKPVASVPVALTAQPATRTDRIARLLMGRELAKARRTGEEPVVLSGMARLANSDVLFVQLQSARECGSAGCDTVSFRKTHGRWVKILDTVGGTIRLAETQHRGMPDLIVKGAAKLIWDGARYV
jgi:hypothetical protein